MSLFLLTGRCLPSFSYVGSSLSPPTQPQPALSLSTPQLSRQGSCRSPHPRSLSFVPRTPFVVSPRDHFRPLLCPSPPPLSPARVLQLQVQGFGFRVSALGFQVQGLRFRVSGFEFRNKRTLQRERERERERERACTDRETAHEM